jgi:predicted amidohydrolase YtcJ
MEAYEENPKENGTKDDRHRVEHTEDPDPAEITRSDTLGVIVSMQPLPALANADVLEVWARRGTWVPSAHSMLGHGTALPRRAGWPSAVIGL